MIETHRYMFLPESERRIIDTLKETGRPMNVSEIVETIFGKLPYWENKQKRSTTIIHLNAMCRKDLLTKTVVDRSNARDCAIYDIREDAE